MKGSIGEPDFDQVFSGTQEITFKIWTPFLQGYSKCGIQYTLPNKKSKLRERLEEVEDLLQHYPVACIACLSSSIIQVLTADTYYTLLYTHCRHFLYSTLANSCWHFLYPTLHSLLTLIIQVQSLIQVLLYRGLIISADNRALSFWHARTIYLSLTRGVHVWKLPPTIDWLIIGYFLYTIYTI